MPSFFSHCITIGKKKYFFALFTKSADARLEAKGERRCSVSYITIESLFLGGLSNLTVLSRGKETI